MGEPLLLDTHCWIWVEAGLTDLMNPAAVSEIRAAAAEQRLLVSVISVWEIGLLESKGRLKLSRDCQRWANQALTIPGLSTAPITPEIAVQSTRLPGNFRGDPADRILVATARAEGARLLTKDRQIIEYGRQKHVRVLAA